MKLLRDAHTFVRTAPALPQGLKRQVSHSQSSLIPVRMPRKEKPERKSSTVWTNDYLQVADQCVSPFFLLRLF